MTLLDISLINLRLKKSSRTLKGYLRCEIGDDEKGDSLYLRKGRFTSYIAGEFYDDINNVYETVGIVFDSFDDGNTDYKYFSYDGAIPDNYFIIDKTPMEIKKLKVYLLKIIIKIKLISSKLIV